MACPAARHGCRVVEGTCSKLRQHYMQHHWKRYEDTLRDPTYVSALSVARKNAVRELEHFRLVHGPRDEVGSRSTR